MAETTDFVSRIKVRDLISAFESKSSSDRVEYSRPRAKSVGNVLAKNVIVQLSEFTSLDDIEKALRKFEANLNFYEVYNKTKHVTFQEQLFNILTSIVNIESDTADTAERRKQLISKTQTLVSFLNQKLPSNESTTTTYKYTPYSSHIKENGTAATEPKYTVADVKPKQAPHSESTKNVEVSEVSEAPFVSVRKLMQNFLAKSDDTPKATSNAEAKAKPKVKQEQPEEAPPKQEEETSEPGAEPAGNVSVSKLRNLFEKKSEESPKGLEIAADDVFNKSPFGGSTGNINFPYTERNLGNIRLQRSASSGNYMNYVGLLKRIDINRTNSAHELNKIGKPSDGKTLIEDFKEDSGAESDTEEDEEATRNVKEFKFSYSTSSLGYLGQQATSTRTQVEEEQKYEHPKVFEATYSLATNDDPEQESIHKVQEIVAAIERVEEERANESGNSLNNETVAKEVEEEDVSPPAKNDDPEQESNHKVQEIVAAIERVEEDAVNEFGGSLNDETVAKEVEDVNSSEINDDPEPKSDHKVQEIVAAIERVEEKDATNESEDSSNNETAKGVEEEDVNYSLATIDDTKQDSSYTNEESFANVEEVKVNYSTAESSNSLGSEYVSDVKGVQEVNVNYSTPLTANIEQSADTDKESVATIEGVEEVEVTYSTPESVDVLENGKDASVEDVAPSKATDDDTVIEEMQRTNSQEDAPIIYTNGVNGSEANERKITTIEEELDKIDVDPTLANEDLFLNPEDLKNADDEFEKLLASSETEKIVT